MGGGLGDGWRVAGKLWVNRCEGVAFLQIEKVTYKIEGQKRNVALATDVEFGPRKATFVGMECGEGIGETGWALVE